MEECWRLDLTDFCTLEWETAAPGLIRTTELRTSMTCWEKSCVSTWITRMVRRFIPRLQQILSMVPRLVLTRSSRMVSEIPGDSRSIGQPATCTLAMSVRTRLKKSISVSYTHLRAHETPEHLVCRLLL